MFPHLGGGWAYTHESVFSGMIDQECELQIVQISSVRRIQHLQMSGHGYSYYTRRPCTIKTVSSILYPSLRFIEDGRKSGSLL